MTFRVIFIILAPYIAWKRFFVYLNWPSCVRL